jgi:branched-chain amino acid transport system permease protein
MIEHITDWIKTNNTLFLLLIPLVLIAVVTSLFGDLLFTRIITVLFINLILVIGLQIFMGNSGILGFSHIGFMGIGAYASVLFSMTPEAKAATLPTLYAFLQPVHLPFLPSLLLGALIAAFIAAIVSYPLMRLSDAAAVITMFSLLVIIQVVLVHWSTVTNGPRTLFGVDNYTTLWISVFFGLLSVVLAFWFKESNIGLRLRASRDDRYAAACSGINIVRVRWVAFIFSAFIAGFGGGLWAHFITSFSPYAFYLTETFAILTMLVVGGPGGVSGAVIGTVLVTLVREGLRGIENNVNIAGFLPNNLVGFTEVATAITLVLILIFRPGGIMGGRELRLRRKSAVPSKQMPPLPLEEKGA